jgi:hypothetical protein
MKRLYTLIQSPIPAHFPGLFQELNIVAERFDSARNLHRALQKQAPDFFLGEFIYGWGNDYAGATVSNLDVTLRTLQATAPQAKIIVLMQASEAAHIDKLLALFSIHAVLKFPITQEQMRATLQSFA